MIPLLNFQFSIPKNDYQQLLTDGATQVIVEVHCYPDSNPTEYSLRLRGKFPNEADVDNEVCPRPCETVSVS